MRSVALLFALVSVTSAGVANPGVGAVSKQALARETAEIQGRYERELADCAGRFAVNACRDEARARQRQGLAAVRARQQKLDESQRSERALSRQAEVRRKQAEVDRRNPLSPAAEPAASLPAQPVRAAVRPPGAPAQQAAAKASERAAAAQRLRREIEADQARIAERMARRAASGKKVVPLPPAPGASGPT